MNKTIPILGLMLSSCLLSACHHENPLKKQTELRSSSFLINASVAAWRGLNPNSTLIDGQNAYMHCMTGHGKNSDCKALFQGMVVFAKKGQFPEFKEVSVADLTDADVFDGLSDKYSMRIAFKDMGK